MMVDDKCSFTMLHADLSLSRIRRDESDVQNLVGLSEDIWTNPFDPNPANLINILIDACPSHKVTNDIMTSHKKRRSEAAYANSKSEHSGQREKPYVGRLS